MANIFHFVFFNTSNTLKLDSSKYIMIISDTGGKTFVCMDHVLFMLYTRVIVAFIIFYIMLYYVIFLMYVRFDIMGLIKLKK